MKRIPFFQLILLVLIPLCVLGGEGEWITSYDALITVKPAGDKTVTETITVAGYGDQIKHGICRDLPTRYKDEEGNRMRVVFEVQDVRKDGKPEPWWTEEMENGVRVYVGRKDVTLPPGRYTYVLTYRTDRQIGFFTTHDELYWNVTGNGWAFPIERAVADLELPSRKGPRSSGLRRTRGLVAQRAPTLPRVGMIMAAPPSARQNLSEPERA